VRILKSLLKIAVVAGLVVLTLPAYSATLTITIEDTSSPGQVLFSPGGSFTCTLPDICGFALIHPTAGSTVLTPLPIRFNIYDDASMTTLSDTLSITAASSGSFQGFAFSFVSDSNGVPPTPLTGATSLVETGDVQFATTIAFSDGKTDDIYFQSSVPEPSSGALAILAGLVFATVRLRHRESPIGPRRQA